MFVWRQGQHIKREDRPWRSSRVTWYCRCAAFRLQAGLLGQTLEKNHQLLPGNKGVILKVSLLVAFD